MVQTQPIHPLGSQVIIRHLELQPYESTHTAMQEFTDNRSKNTVDEIWLVEHHPVFTQGQAGKEEHIIASGDIPVVQSDRGGQVTYHGPGQIVAYFLIDLRRKNMGVRELVTDIENIVINTLASFEIDSMARLDAPGVYVGEKKICSLGLRIRKGCSFHGLALNVAMDLSPFERINPCGYAGMEMTQINAFTGINHVEQVTPILVQQITHTLGYQQVDIQFADNDESN